MKVLALTPVHHRRRAELLEWGGERVEQSRALDNVHWQGPTMTGITLQAWTEGQTEAVDSKGSSDIPCS